MLVYVQHGSRVLMQKAINNMGEGFLRLLWLDDPKQAGTVTRLLSAIAGGYLGTHGLTPHTHTLVVAVKGGDRRADAPIVDALARAGVSVEETCWVEKEHLLEAVESPSHVSRSGNFLISLSAHEAMNLVIEMLHPERMLYIENHGLVLMQAVPGRANVFTLPSVGMTNSVLKRTATDFLGGLGEQLLINYDNPAWPVNVFLTDVDIPILNTGLCILSPPLAWKQRAHVIEAAFETTTHTSKAGFQHFSIEPTIAHHVILANETLVHLAIKDNTLAIIADSIDATLKSFEQFPIPQVVAVRNELSPRWGWRHVLKTLIERQASQGGGSTAARLAARPDFPAAPQERMLYIENRGLVLLQNVKFDSYRLPVFATDFLLGLGDKLLVNHDNHVFLTDVGFPDLYKGLGLVCGRVAWKKSADVAEAAYDTSAHMSSGSFVPFTIQRTSAECVKRALETLQREPPAARAPPPQMPFDRSRLPMQPPRLQVYDNMNVYIEMDNLVLVQRRISERGDVFYSLPWGDRDAQANLESLFEDTLLRFSAIKTAASVSDKSGVLIYVLNGFSNFESMTRWVVQIFAGAFSAGDVAYLPRTFILDASFDTHSNATVLNTALIPEESPICISKGMAAIFRQQIIPSIINLQHTIKPTQNMPNPHHCFLYIFADIMGAYQAYLSYSLSEVRDVAVDLLCAYGKLNGRALLEALVLKLGVRAVAG